VKQMRSKDKPPFSIIRFSAEVFMGYVFGLVYYCAIPFEEVYPPEIKFLTYLTPIAITLGVHTVGNIGREQGGMKSTLLSTAVSWYCSQNEMPQGMLWCAIAASCAFTFKSREWRRTPPEKHGICKRITILGTCGLFYTLLLASGIYFNAEIVDKHGEKVKVRDAAINFLNSPMWEEFKESLQQLYNFYQAHGWRKLHEQIIEQLDPHGERRAYKVLGLPTSATKPEIMTRWRQLSKEWHPDRHQDPAMKEEAHVRFMEYQGAYQTLIKIRAKTGGDTTTTTTPSPTSRSDL